MLFTLPQQNLPAVAAAIAAGSVGGAGAAPAGDRHRRHGITDTAAGTPAGGGAGRRSQPAPLDRGTLTVLDNQVDPTTGTIKLKASFPNKQMLLWPGAFVTVRLRVDTLHDAVVVPPVAVQRGPRGAFVYVANDDQTVARRNVSVAHEDISASVIIRRAEARRASRGRRRRPPDRQGQGAMSCRPAGATPNRPVRRGP